MDEENAFRLYTKEEADARGIGYDPQVEIRCLCFVKITFQ